MSGGLFTFGEALLRLSVPEGERLEDARSLSVHEGGSEANVAVAVARMGHAAAWWSRLPETPLGRRIVAGIGSSGADVSEVKWVPDGRIGIYYVDPPLSPHGGQVIYDRQGSTVCELTVHDVPWQRVESATVVHLSGITPALSPSLAEVTSEVAKRARAAGGFVTFDVNYRSRLWSIDKARPVIAALGAQSHLSIIGQDDARAFFGVESESPNALGSLHDALGTDSIILTVGDRGSAWSIQGCKGTTPAPTVRVVDPIGAGDAFAAGVIVGVLEGDVEHGIELGTGMAALTLGSNGDRFWGDRDHVTRLLTEPEPGLVR